MVDLIKSMDSIRYASNYLLGIINDILDVQRMETGTITLKPVETDPSECMRTITTIVGPMAAEKNIHFSYHARNGAENNYLVDELRVQQILFNVLYNAVKFTPEGGIITMTSDVVKKDESHAAIRVVIADTGVGMNREFLETKLFHKFEQENHDITSPYAGCGTGLAICKELVNMMDGEIRCESEPNKGTTFTITINAEYHRRRRSRRSRKPMNCNVLTGMHVLMCEDNPVNREIEERLLEKAGCTVDTAENGKIGCTLFAQSAVGQYHVILMDIRMPEMDGLQAAEIIRAMSRSDAQTIPIFAVSANAFEEDVQKSLDAGMNEHLAKPMDVRIICEKMKQYCRLGEEQKKETM